MNKVYLCNKNGNDFKVKPSFEAPVWEAGMAIIKGVVFDDTTQNVQVKIEAEKYFAARESEVRIHHRAYFYTMVIIDGEEYL